MKRQENTSKSSQTSAAEPKFKLRRQLVTASKKKTFNDTLSMGARRSDSVASMISQENRNRQTPSVSSYSGLKSQDPNQGSFCGISCGSSSQVSSRKRRREFLELPEVGKGEQESELVRFVLDT